MHVLKGSFTAAALATCVTLGAVVARADARPPPRGEALPARADAAGDTRSGTVVLSSPGSAMVRFPEGEMTMGSAPEDIVDAVLLCARETQGELCELPLFYEFALTRDRMPLESALQNEMSRHRVQLDAFWMDRREVTVADYLRCADVGACARPPFAEGAKRFDKPTLPVSFVSWDDAKAYCKFRGARLPTEAEWERAARGVSARRYPWGNEYNRKLANHGSFALAIHRLGMDTITRFAEMDHDDRDGFLELAPVGSFPDGRTPEGLFDMAGNVAEWVEDPFEPRYEDGPVKNPKGPPASPLRVIRGGSFVHGAPYMRAAARMVARPGDRQSFIGFRCAKDG